MPDSGTDSGSLWDKIKGFIPVAMGAGLGALAGGGPGALAGAGGAAEAEAGQQQQDAARQEKILSVMSLLEERKAREAYQQESLEQREQAEQDRKDQQAAALAERTQQNQVNDSLRSLSIQQNQAYRDSMLEIQRGNQSLRQEDIDLRATLAANKTTADGRMDAAAQILSATSGGKMTAAEAGMALTHAGLSATGAMFVANRALEMQKNGKPISVDSLIGEAGKAKDQYGAVLDNVSSAMTDPKAEGAKMLGAGAYSNYLISKAKLGTLPPAERAAAEKKIKKFAAASIKPANAGADWQEPTYDDLASMLDPSAPDDSAKAPAAPAAAPSAPKAGAGAAALPKGLPEGSKDNGDGTWTLPDGTKVAPRK